MMLRLVDQGGFTKQQAEILIEELHKATGR
jgi:hypothetical protein